ncbi:MAG: L-asparaginase [Pseudonocardiales bacterium]|jgi:L-asparaginase|nr:L-asparaginase [Pseudonocardiales bacterium]MDT4919919.1 L-asparaginase [Pseudonocardiales bacterium]MDT4941381.1 L-asparaginase [Pseudonocardiales bacterium]
MAHDARVALFALGGTISMTGASHGGVVPRLTGDDLLAGLGALPVQVDVHDAVPVPSAALSFADVLDTVAAAQRAVARGAIGVVLSQGTDTLEETAFLIDSVWEDEAPFVVTGAMRNPTLPGADGPANLHAAIEVAAAAAARGRGVLVAFLDEIHAARHLRKTHSTSPAAFASPDLGPIGHVVEGTPRFLVELPRRTPITGWTIEQLMQTRVALYTVTLDDDGKLLDGPDHSHQGLVIAGFGAGHVPPTLLPAIDEIIEAMPVVLTSRSGAGPVLAETYSAPGSERDLLARGVIGGGFVHPFKARVLLRLLVAAGADRKEIATAFAQLG